MNDIITTMIWRYTLHTTYEHMWLNRYGTICEASSQRSAEIYSILSSAGVNVFQHPEFWRAYKKYNSMGMDALRRLAYPV